MSEIEVKHLSKTFEQKGVHVDALKDINLTIGAGDIYGIIGMSGAGKSTLVRCLNFLERPTDGQVLIEGKDLGTLNEKELRKQRRTGEANPAFDELVKKMHSDEIQEN